MRIVCFALALFVTLVAVTLPGWRSAHASPVALNLSFGAGPLAALGSHAQTSPPGVIASAVAPSKSGTVVLSLSHATGSSAVNLTILVGTQSLNFAVPARDLTLSSSSLSLDTHSDLKNYGSIQLTWTQKEPTSTKPPANYCGGGYGGPPSTWVTYINGKGSAHLNLPCIGQLAPAFTGTDHSSATYITEPTSGYFKGIYAFVSLAPTSYEDLSFEVTRVNGRQIQAVLTLLRRYNSTLLTSHNQQIAVTITNSKALQVDSRLNSASLDLTNGPTLLKGTKLSWVPSAVAVTATKISSCKETWSGGATRQTFVTGAIDLHACLMSGSFQDKSENAAAGFIYSNTAKPQPAPALKLVSTSPANNATKVSKSLSAITATFSNPIVTSGTDLSLQGPSGSGPVTIPVSSAGNADRTLTFKLATPLDPNTKYTLTFTGSDTYKQLLHATAQFTTGS